MPRIYCPGMTEELLTETAKIKFCGKSRRGDTFGQLKGEICSSDHFLFQKKYDESCKERDKAVSFAKSVKEQLNLANTSNKEDHEDKVSHHRTCFPPLVRVLA